MQQASVQGHGSPWYSQLQSSHLQSGLLHIILPHKLWERYTKYNDYINSPYLHFQTVHLLTSSIEAFFDMSHSLFAKPFMLGDSNFIKTHLLLLFGFLLP